jgi:hypothetical protein
MGVPIASRITVTTVARASVSEIAGQTSANVSMPR